MGTAHESTRSSIFQNIDGPTLPPPDNGPARHAHARWRRRPHLLLLLLLLSAAFFLVLRPSIRGNDGVQNYAYLHSLVFDGDLDFTNEYLHYFSRHAEWFDGKDLPRDPVTGRPMNLYGVGNSLLWSPWVLTAHGLGIVANSFGANLHLDGYSPLYEWAVGAASCFYASAGLFLLFGLLRTRFGDDRAFWAILTVWLASPLFFYMYLHPSMSHANSFFLAALMLRLYLGGDSLRRWAGLGAVAGLLILTRFQDAVLLSVLGVGELFRLRDNMGVSRLPAILAARLPRYLLFGAVTVVVFSPQFLAWNTLQGTPFSGPRAYTMQGSLQPWAPRHIFDALFSSFHGLFHWHPALLLGLVGLIIGASRQPRLKLISLTGFAAQAWVIGSWSIWWAGASFGHRMFISTLPFLAVGLASAMGRTDIRGRFLRGAVLFLILWNFGLVVQYGLGMIDRQAPVPLTTITRNNVIEIPRLLIERIRDYF